MVCGKKEGDDSDHLTPAVTPVPPPAMTTSTPTVTLVLPATTTLLYQRRCLYFRSDHFRVWQRSHHHCLLLAHRFLSQSLMCDECSILARL